jgi:hypothetical protein
VRVAPCPERTVDATIPSFLASLLAFTFPMNLLWGAFRRRSQSIWLGFGLPVLTNLPGLFGT